MKTLHTTLATCIAAALTLCIFYGHIIIAAATMQSDPHVGITLAQGEVIYTQNATCTAGYIDPDTRTLYIAGHCGKNGEVVYNSKGQKLGTLISGYRDGSTVSRNDIGTVKLGEWVINQGNTFSGDNHVAPRDIAPHDTVCSYSTRQTQVLCGEVIDVDDTVIVTERRAGGIPGDSGGPSWVLNPDGSPKGFAGVYIGFWEPTEAGFVSVATPNTKGNDDIVITTFDGTEKMMGRAPRDTETITPEEVEHINHTMLQQLGITPPPATAAAVTTPHFMLDVLGVPTP